MKSELTLRTEELHAQFKALRAQNQKDWDDALVEEHGSASYMFEEDEVGALSFAERHGLKIVKTTLQRCYPKTPEEGRVRNAWMVKIPHIIQFNEFGDEVDGPYYK